MAGIYKRSLERFGGRKDFEIQDIRTTPADELSSWLGDDVCTNCGGPTQHGKLFCSDKCKLADADEVAQATKDGFAQVLSSPSRSDAFAREEINEKFRYPCPPSPNLLAQYSTPLKTTSLTSPALSAFQSSLPAPRGRFDRDSNDSPEAFQRPGPNKRSSSQSTFSSVSESNGSASAFASTDPSTPSPVYGATEDESSSDLDANELQLPPSVSTASSVMLRKSSSRGSPQTQEAPLPHGTRKTSDSSQQQKSPMWYARRPSTTNMPLTRWYLSPALTATTKITATGHGLFNNPREDAQATLTRRAAKELYSVNQRTISLSSRTSPPGSVPMRRGHSDHLNTRSPPQIQSAASSASKTMRANSPASARPFSPVSTDQSCDRCRTLSNMSGELDIYATSGRSSESRKSSSPTLGSSYHNRSMRLRHKHSHSAAAGLFFTQLQVQEELDAERQRHRTAAVQQFSIYSTPSPKTSALASQQAEHRLTPQRGRSKARGRSSHRRDVSPPRAAARRPSLADEQSTFPLPISSKLIPISISIKSKNSGDETYHHDENFRSALPERPSPLALKSFNDQQEIADSVEQERGRGRGRAQSTARDRNPSRRDWVHKDVEVTWSGYGHRDSDRGRSRSSGSQSARSPSRRRESRRSTREFADPGFDDVELELDGDDEDSTSSESSFEESPGRGRATRRA